MVRISSPQPPFGAAEPGAALRRRGTAADGARLRSPAGPCRGARVADIHQSGATTLFRGQQRTIGQVVDILSPLAPVQAGVEPQRIPPGMAYSPNVLFHPPLQPKPLAVGTPSFPSIAKVFDFTFMEEWSKVVNVITGGGANRPPHAYVVPPGGMAPIASVVNARNRYIHGFLQLLTDYATYPAGNDEAGLIRTMATTIAADIAQVTDPNPALPSPVPAAGNLAVNPLQWKAAIGVNVVDVNRPHWSQGPVNVPQEAWWILSYANSADPPLAAARTQAYDFSTLMDKLFVPPSVRTEIDNWIGAGPGVQPAPSTAKFFAVMSYIWSKRKSPSYNAPPDCVNAFNAFKHFQTFYESIFDPRSGNLKDLPAAQRKIRWCPIDPVAQEKRGLQIAVGDSLTAFFARFNVPLDEIVRGGILCAIDRNDQKYAERADGAIVIVLDVQAPVPVAGANYTAFGASMGAANGVAILSQKTPMEGYALWAHEIGHTLFMQHFRNASSYLLDHDHGDPNCIMSYPLLGVARLDRWAQINTPGFEYERRFLDAEGAEGAAMWPNVHAVVNDCAPPGGPAHVSAESSGKTSMKNVAENALPKIMRTHFCGKCNLKLRGWDIRKIAPPPGGGTAGFVLPLDSGVPIPPAWPGLT